jgi:hypothetical protein
MVGIGCWKPLKCENIYEIAERRLAAISQCLSDLKRIELAPLVETCQRKGDLAACTIVSALSHVGTSRVHYRHEMSSVGRDAGVDGFCSLGCGLSRGHQVSRRADQERRAVLLPLTRLPFGAERPSAPNRPLKAIPIRAMTVRLVVGSTELT